MTAGCVLGAFRLERPLAHGGMAQVWAATHRRSGMGVSVKVITGERAHDAYFRTAFLNEVRAVAGLDHPGVVLVLDYGLVPEQGPGELVPGCPYLVMEPASGGTLHDGRKRVLVWPEIRTILTSLLGALGHAHARGVIHRDLKPGNVLVCNAEDPRPGLKLSDFGLARHLEEFDRTGSVEAVRGTLHYMAPEQCRGLWRDQGPWTDLYALGCIAYQLATGRPPFRGLKGDELMRAHVELDAPPLPPRRGLPDGYADWVARLLRKRPGDRFQRAADAAWALARLPDPDDVGPTRWVFPVLARTQGLSDDLQTDPNPRTPLPGDLEADVTDEHEGAVVRVGLLATAAGHVHRPGDIPPIPPSWREPQAPTPDLRLVDAGLGLFDLRPLALVGRDSERDHLWSELRTVSEQGRARCAVLIGSHGNGITRLSSWLGSRAHEVGAAHVFLMRNSRTESPLRPLRRMLARALNAAGLSRVEARVRVERFAERTGLDRTDAAALHALLQPEGLRRADAPGERYALVSRVLATFAGDRVVILRVEDLQWGSEAVGLIRHLLSQPAEQQFPVLIVATHRVDTDAPLGEERLTALTATEGTTTLAPGPLPPADMQTLVRGRMRLGSELALQVLEVCRGNPLFAVQLVADWAERGLLVPADDGFALRPGAAVEIPDDLHEVWDARVAHALEDLPLRAEVQLERAAVLGEVFRADLWKVSCELDDPPAGAQVRARLITKLLDHRLLYLDRHRFRFAHTLLRESLLRRAREAGRLADHHDACARVLARLRSEESDGGDGGWRLAESLGRHLHAAGDRRGALEPLLEAAEAWLVAGGHRECLALVAIAESIVADIGIPLTDPRQVRMVHLRVVCHHRRGEKAEARSWVGRALALAHRVDRAEQRALLRLDAVQVGITRQDWAGAERLMRGVREDLDTVTDTRLLLQAAFAEGHLERGRGRLEEARAWLEEAHRLAEQIEDLNSQGSALRDLGVIAWLRQDVPEALRLYGAARDVLARGGSLKDLAAAMNNLGECHRALGDLEAAEEHYRESAALFTRAGASAAAPYPWTNLGLILVHTGRFQEALGALTRALEEVDRQGISSFEAIIRVLIAPCCAALEDWQGWTRQLDRLTELGALPLEVEPEMALGVRRAAERALAAQRTQEALRGWRLAAALYRQIGLEEDAEACERARALIQDAP